jgi:hypothetical protein
MLIPLPFTLASFAQPFDDRNWLYEIEHDGFRALAVRGRPCRLNGQFASTPKNAAPLDLPAP